MRRGRQNKQVHKRKVHGRQLKAQEHQGRQRSSKSLEEQGGALISALGGSTIALMTLDLSLWALRATRKAIQLM